MLSKTYGKADIESTIKAAGMTCKIRGFRAVNKPSASITVYTGLSGKSVLIHFARWAYANWPVNGQFWITVMGTGVKGFNLYLEGRPPGLRLLANNTNGPECRWLDGIADENNPLLHPDGRVLLWEIVEAELILKVECLQSLRFELKI